MKIFKFRTEIGTILVRTDQNRSKKRTMRECTVVHSEGSEIPRGTTLRMPEKLFTQDKRIK